jgi:hypothetical protein
MAAMRRETEAFALPIVFLEEGKWEGPSVLILPSKGLRCQLETAQALALRHGQRPLIGNSTLRRLHPEKPIPFSHSRILILAAISQL